MRVSAQKRGSENECCEGCEGCGSWSEAGIGDDVDVDVHVDVYVYVDASVGACADPRHGGGWRYSDRRPLTDDCGSG